MPKNPDEKKWTDRLPIESFDPRFRELLLRATLGQVVIACASGTEAHRFRNRCYEFRAAAKAADDPDWPKLRSVVISRSEDGLTPSKRSRGRFLLFTPQEFRFDSVFNSVGIKAPAGQEDILDAAVLSSFAALAKEG